MMPIFIWLLAILGILFGLAIATAIGVDIWLYLTGRKTISRWMADISKQYPIIPASLGLAFGFIVGALAGHWFFPE